MNRLTPKTAPQDTEKLTTITPPESPLAALQAPFRRLKSVAAAALISLGGLDTDQAQAGRIDPSVPIETYRQMGEQARGPISWSLDKDGTWVQLGGAGYLRGTSIVLGYNSEGTFSGVFVNPRTFVTAARNIVKFQGDVKVGWSRDSYNPTLPEITVSKIIVHPEYRPDQQEKGPDIAVVHLSKPVRQVDAAGVEGDISGSCYLLHRQSKSSAFSGGIGDGGMPEQGSDDGRLSLV